MTSAPCTSHIFSEAEQVQASIRYSENFRPLTTLGLPRPPIEAFWGNKPRIPELLEKRTPVASLFTQQKLTQYRGSFSGIVVASAGSLYAARRQGTFPHFTVQSPRLRRQCLTMERYTGPSGSKMYTKDPSFKSTNLSRPADHKPKAKTNGDQSIPSGAEQSMDFEASSFDRVDKRIDVIVQQILPDMPHLVSVPTKTPYVREFPNENLNTPFEDWEVQKLQHMTLVSDGNRGVACVRGNWAEELNVASPYSGFRSGTATPRSEREGHKIRTKISFADYKAGNKTTSSFQTARLNLPQINQNGQNSVSKDPESPTQQLIDQIIQKSESKSLPRYNEKYINDEKHPFPPANPKPPPKRKPGDPPEPEPEPQPEPEPESEPEPEPEPEPLPPSDAPHPLPLPKPQNQAEEGRVVWPPPNKPDWKHPKQQELPAVERVGPKLSDYAIHKDHPQHHLKVQKRQMMEQKRQQREEKLEDKLVSKKGTSKSSPTNANPVPVAKKSPAIKAVSTGAKSQGAVMNGPKSTNAAEISKSSKSPMVSSRISQKGPFGTKKQTSTDVNVSNQINAMPPLLSPLPEGLLSPDHLDLQNDNGTRRLEPNHIDLPSSSQLNAADIEKAHQDMVSPLESPFEMPRLLSPLPDWWLQKVEAAEARLLRNVESENAVSNPGTHGARRERSRQPDTRGVARKTTKSNKAKSGLATDTMADYDTSMSNKDDENNDRIDEKLSSNRNNQGKLIIKLKYGKRNNKTISRLLQMKARPVAEARIAPSSTSGSRKHNRISDDIEEPSTKRNRVVNHSTTIPASQKNDTVMPTRISSDAAHSSEKRPKTATKNTATPNSLTSEVKKHPRPIGDTEEPSTKRAKVIGNADSQRVSTPLTPNAQSPAPIAAQKTFSTPKKGDAMKTVAMRRVDSNDGQVLTPHGGSVSTPASTEKPRTSGGDSKSAEVEVLKSTQNKYLTLGTVLKRQADQILKIKEKDPGPVSDEEKRYGAVIAIEAVIAYMIGFNAGDLARQKERKVGHAEQWSQFLPFMDFATDRAKGHGELFTLALMLNALSRECLERIYMERIQTDPAGAGLPYLRELAKNSHLRQSAWSAYREQCKEHNPVEYISAEEVKSVAGTILANYCKKMNIAWETKLEF